jgi:hypothetical protein
MASTTTTPSNSPTSSTVNGSHNARSLPGALIPAGDGHVRTYHDLANDAVLVDTESTNGIVTVTLASLDDIIESKQWANRAKDRDALPELIALRDTVTIADHHAGIGPIERASQHHDFGPDL